MCDNKMELSNEDLKIISDKYDPQDKGKIYYHYICDDMEEKTGV